MAAFRLLFFATAPPKPLDDTLEEQEEEAALLSINQCLLHRYLMRKETVLFTFSHVSPASCMLTVWSFTMGQSPMFSFVATRNRRCASVVCGCRRIRLHWQIGVSTKPPHISKLL